jgi:type IV secretion system protein VirB2
MIAASPAIAQDSYADPAGSSVLVSAVNWLQGTLLGTVATVVAVILGCFILFGASTIVAGIHSAATLSH